MEKKEREKMKDFDPIYSCFYSCLQLPFALIRAQVFSKFVPYLGVCYNF